MSMVTLIKPVQNNLNKDSQNLQTLDDDIRLKNLTQKLTNDF